MSIPVSVGICAYNEGPRVRQLLESIQDQRLPAPLDLREILVVASGCTDGTEDVVGASAERDRRIQLIRQPVRQGKASAINEILRTYRGELLVLTNADACLARGSLPRLLRPFLNSPETVLACGAPVPLTDGARLPAVVEEVQWGIHNRSLETLSRLDAPNHCCDELLAFRRGFVDALPAGLINDGAYLGVLAGIRGRTVRFCADATVYVRVPRTLQGLVRQRRRVLAGHRQVRDFLHRPANTLEALARRDPRLAASILLAELRRRPSSAAFLLLALPLELVSMALALADRAWGPGSSPVWPKVEAP